MNRLNRIFEYKFFSAVVYCLCPVALLSAQQQKVDTTHVYSIPEVVVSDRYQTREVRATAPTQIFSKEELNNLHVLQVSDAVKHFAGVTVKDYGGIGGLKTVSIRSLGAQHTAIGYDGIAITDCQTGQIDIGRFSLDNVDRLSLNNGQSDNIFQPARFFASAGLLNIQTLTPQFKNNKNTHIIGSFKTGSWGLVNPSVLIEQKLARKWALSANAEWMSADGHYPYTLYYGDKDDLTSREKRKNTQVESLRAEAGLFGNLSDNEQWRLKAYYYQSSRDTANDMAIYGSKLYIVVNVSSQIEVIDRASGLSLKRIPVLNENGSSRQPRYIAFHKDKAYVCSFDGTVARIDTTSLEIEEYATVGRNPDGICVQGDKLYVSNSGGLDWDGIGVDNTVSVVSTEPFKEIKKIQVGYNPGRIRADNYGHVYVATRGKDISAGDYNFVQIDTRTDEVKQIYDEKVMNFAINDQLAYLYNFNYTTQDSQIKVFNLQTGTTLREDFITDETEINTPYGIYVNPYSGNIYITDAYNYLVRGDVLCFNPQGKLIYRLTNIGQNPNTVVFSDKDTQSGNDDPDTPQAAAFANKVLEYRPAPTQFMNTTATAYKEGFTYQQVLEYATELLSDRNVCLLSLGAFGGYITVGFDHTVPNVSGEYDFKIYGNAAYDIYGTNEDKPGGSAEPGIVLVSKDTNGNGLPDDEWYELAGSEYNSPSTIRNYEITYYRPELPGDNVQWTDNQGGQGEIKRNDFNTQDSYYPQWIEEDRITFSGNRLADNAVNEPRPDMPEHWVGYCYAWGYADNHPNDTEYSKFKIDWAVDKNGNPVHLDGIDFVKIYTAVNQDCGWTGEISTEIQAVEDLHYNK